MSARRAGTSGAVLAGEPGQLRAGGVDDAHGVVGEIGRLDQPRPRAGSQAGEDVLAVLLVLIAAGLPSGVGDPGDQGGGACAEPPGHQRQGRLPAAGARSLAWSFFTRTGFGTYKLNTPPADTPWTIPPDP